MTNYIDFINIGFLTKISFALIIGFIIGLERETKGKPAGIKTYALICLGATIFTHISISIQGVVDASRVAAQIVSGLGFIGAGAIFQSKRIITGLTTAASMWVVGALGTLVGLEFYDEAIMTLIIIMIYLYLSKISHHVMIKKNRYSIEIQVNHRDQIPIIRKILKEKKSQNIKCNWADSEKSIKVEWSYINKHKNHLAIIEQLDSNESIKSLKVI